MPAVGNLPLQVLARPRIIDLRGDPVVMVLRLSYQPIFGCLCRHSPVMLQAKPLHARFAGHNPYGIASWQQFALKKLDSIVDYDPVSATECGKSIAGGLADSRVQDRFKIAEGRSISKDGGPEFCPIHIAFGKYALTETFADASLHACVMCEQFVYHAVGVDALCSAEAQQDVSHSAFSGGDAAS